VSPPRSRTGCTTVAGEGCEVEPNKNLLSSCHGRPSCQRRRRPHHLQPDGDDGATPVARSGGAFARVTETVLAPADPPLSSPQRAPAECIDDISPSSLRSIWTTSIRRAEMVAAASTTRVSIARNRSIGSDLLACDHGRTRTRKP